MRKHVQFCGHHHMRPVCVQGALLLEQVDGSVVRVDEENSLTKDLEVYNFACINAKSGDLQTRSEAEYSVGCVPYCSAHSVARTHNSFKVKSNRFPTSGLGFGPGGMFLRLLPIDANSSAEKVAMSVRITVEEGMLRVVYDKPR